MAGAVRETERGCEIDLWVVPGASRAEIVGLHDGRLKVRVAARPEGGSANREVERLIKGRLGVPAVLSKGMGSRRKVLEVTALDADTVRRKLGIAV